MSMHVQPCVHNSILFVHTHTHTATLSIYENRHGTNDGGVPFFETWAVEGVATIELGGSTGITFSMDCNTTTGDGSDIVWLREQGTHDFDVIQITKGKRLDLEGVTYTDLGVYLCRSDDSEIYINITSSKCLCISTVSQ